MLRATRIFAQFKDDPRYIPVGGRMKIRYMYEMRDGKVTDSDHEIIKNEGMYTDWTGKSVPARTLPSGGRTIRIEEE